MQYGPLSSDDASFRAVCMLLAHHPQYQQMPVRRLVDFRELVQKQQTYCALDGHVLAGLVAWHPISSEAARAAVCERKWPRGHFTVGDGGGRLVGAFIAPSREESLPFFRRFAAESKGRILIFERHRPQRAPRFLWIDRSGVLLGPDL